MFLLIRGNDSKFQIGIAPTTDNKNGNGCVDSLTRVPFDLNGVQCVSGGTRHFIIIKDFRVFAAGDNSDFLIGSGSRQVYKTFTEIKISEEQIFGLHVVVILLSISP